MRKSIFFLLLFFSGVLPGAFAGVMQKNIGVTDNPKKSGINFSNLQNRKIERHIKNINTITSNKNTSTLNIDTIITPAVNSAASIDSKVIISSDDNELQFSALSSFNNGVLIQPVDKSTNKGIATAFYLNDTSSWSFYTDARKRLSINGNGEIHATGPLLINGAVSDGVFALGVSGDARFDSSIILQSRFNPNSFISINSEVKSAAFAPDDGISPYTTTPIGWAQGKNLPVFRLRHPLRIMDQGGVNTSVQRDFMILPYQYGMAIEYNGVVECWVGEWSIHRGLQYYDTEGKGNGWGGVLWVGDDIDAGGVRATARNNTSLGGNVAYGEISVEKFVGTPNGDFRLRLPSTQNQFHFVYGDKGSENIIAKVTNQGLILPKVTSVAATQAPEKAQILFDSTDNKFKGYDGVDWVTLGTITKTGSYTTSANDIDQIFYVPHGMGSTPSYFNVIATSPRAADVSYITANNTYIIIHYTSAPFAGTNNLSWNWEVKK